MKPSSPLITLGLALSVTGCVELTYPLNREGRETEKVAPASQACSPEESGYIRARRRAAGLGAYHGDVLGVAFSGGGVRSATVNLGVLQGLEDEGLLRKVDYLSCVSGGGYIGGWYVSHLRTATEYKRLEQSLAGRPDELSHFAISRRDLLEMYVPESSNDKGSLSVAHLRHRAGIFDQNGARAGNLAYSGGWWLGSLGPNLLLDVGAHFQPLPGKFNITHPFYAYRRLLEDTYLMGWEKVSGPTFDGSGRQHASPSFAYDINVKGSQTPYLICNGALGNSDLGRKDGDGKSSRLSDNHNFEFTHDRCGSPLIGWVPTKVFDRPVAKVITQNDGTLKTEFLRGPLPGTQTKSFRLSTAVAASGAAVDSATFGGLNTRVATNTALGLVNANLRYQTSNFSQNLSAWWQRPADRVREVTADRFIRSSGSNTLQISDGGHFENLGVYALLRRNVSRIVAIDASQDLNYKYDDLKRLLQLIQECGWAYEDEDGRIGNLGVIAPVKIDSIKLPKQFTQSRIAPNTPIWKFRVLKPDHTVCTVWYVKNSFRPSDLKNPAAKDLSAFRDYPGELNKCFPHVGTFKVLGWSQPQFDTYREMGRLLGRWAASEVEGDKSRR